MIKGLTFINSSEWLHTVPAEGSLRYNPANGEMEVWDGHQWLIMSSNGPVASSTKFTQQGLTVILVDYDHWDKHDDELDRWLDQTVEGGRHCRTGMMIEFNNKEDLLVFTLTWS